MKVGDKVRFVRCACEIFGYDCAYSEFCSIVLGKARVGDIFTISSIYDNETFTTRYNVTFKLRIFYVKENDESWFFTELEIEPLEMEEMLPDSFFFVGK